MFCNSCGTALQPDDRFCRRCGAAVETPGTSAPAGTAPAAAGPAPVGVVQPVRGRVARHLQSLSILWIVVSIFRALGGVVLIWVGRIFLPNLRAWIPDAQVEPPIPPFVFSLVSGIGFALLALGIFGLAAGWGLMQREAWARTGALILAILSLPEVPVGTILGIYTLWALMAPDGDEEYRSLARY